MAAPEPRTSVTFETATIADAIKKASRVSPAKGKAFDEAGGIVIEITTGESPQVIIRATNLDVFQTEWVDCVRAEGEDAIWRLPTGLLASFMASLPIGTGKEVVLQEIKQGLYSHIKISAGRAKAKLNLLDVTDYPSWGTFDPDDLTPILDFGGKVDMVEWAANSSEQPPLSGVNFTGTEVQATDRYRVAVAPLIIPGLEEPATVPSGILGQILKQTGEVRVKFTEHQLFMMPDSTTQIISVIYGAPYPKMKKIKDRERPQSFTVRKDDLLAVINRSTLASQTERVPTLRMFIGAEEVACMTEGTDQVYVGDILEVAGQCTHERFEIKFTPKNLVDSLNKVPNERVTIGYDISNPMAVLYLNGGSGFEAWVVTTRGTES